jgi:cholesterol oxidase
MTERKKEELVREIEQRLEARKIDRREFGRYLLGGYGAVVSTSVLASAADAFFAERAGAQALPPHLQHEAVVIGSGIGGSVMAARLSRQWPGQVLMIERGKRYPKGSFPRSAEQLVGAILRNDHDDAPRPLPLPGASNGLLDLRSFDGIDVLVANGYGGGSLIYAAAMMEPSIPGFDESWPSTIKKNELVPYFDVFRKVIQARKVPAATTPERHLPKVPYYQLVAQRTGGQSDLVDVGVFFGNDVNDPTPMGQAQENLHGAPQTSCVYCAECLIGCNHHSKNSTDLNYLYAAEHYYGLSVLTEKRVDRIVPLTSAGRESIWEDGSHGYRVYFENALDGRAQQSVTARRVILSAGSLGTTEILMRNRDRHRTLWRVSGRVGKGFSANGDFVGLVLGGEGDNGQSYGPTLVQRVKYDDPKDPSKSFAMEDMSLPRISTLLATILSLSQQAGSPWAQVWKLVQNAFGEDESGKNTNFSAVVFVGKDASNGEFSLSWKGGLRLSWSYWDSRALFDRIIDKLDEFKRAVNAELAIYLPTYVWPLRRNFTVHPLGGCALGTSIFGGVTSASRRDLGRVFGYANLYVADGSLVPSALGANPSLTIGALSEMVAEGITGTAPSPEL